MRVMTSVEAQNHFGELIDAAQREPVTITRRGRPVVYVVSQQEYDELTKRLAINQSQVDIEKAKAAVAVFAAKAKAARSSGYWKIAGLIANGKNERLFAGYICFTGPA